ncbi:transketolase family protein [uncultured Oscillibacter sp.]|uniref:transketolase family protein n=1 Tax=uncultured Oscillibacter sp. TaxID=876091 RepID=UPI0025FB4F80|nr:transketolase C-terminal domain-containing protein [uncultured Oscillibacter sp.]
MFHLIGAHQDERADVRETIVSTLVRMIEEDPRVVYLDCDTMDALGIREMRERYPRNVLSCGIQEANMIGVAAGLSAMGRIPYVHSFAAFATRRCYDQVFLSVGYAKNSVKIIGTDAGITSAYNGGTHMPFEDVALMRAIPQATVVEATDSVMAEDLLEKIKEIPGVVYLRTARKRTKAVYAPGSGFEIGRGALLREGGDATVFACGIMVDAALLAAEAAREEGLSLRVVDMFSIKPIDRDIIIDSAQKTGAVVTAEDHSTIGGLGDAVAAVLAENVPVPMGRVGVRDLYGEVGSVAYLQERFQLTPEHILDEVKAVIRRKR